ncbi:MAG: tetratricopeptide repeat protein, partial [Bryobacterales bacterium]|nr:tetratricopeptide repeat protein [Bryobacterales bacterium]
MRHKVQDDDMVMGLVEMVLSSPPDQGESHLRAACAGDGDLFDEVWRYVQWEQRMRGFLLDPFCLPVPAANAFEPGQLLDNRFRIVREVAQGGMGIVYEAVDEKLGRRIALKCAKAGFTQRLTPEVRNASEISHPNICKIFEIHTASTDQGAIDFITMEYLDGHTLADLLDAGPVPPRQAAEIARQICAGLAEAHRQQVTHGDLKTSNIIVTRSPGGEMRAVITDFGLARRPDSSQWATLSSPVGGAFDYMAPELWKGIKPSISSDIFALGVILKKLGRGRLGRAWNRTVTRCLDPEPTLRFPTASEVTRSLFPVTRRWLLGAVAAVIAIFAVIPPIPPKEPVNLAVLPLDAGKNVAPLGDALSRQIAGQLARLKSGPRTKLTVMPLSGAIPPKATHAFRGAFNWEKDRLVLHAYVTDARTKVDAREWRVSYAPGELRHLPVAVAGMVTQTFRLPPLLAGAEVNEAARQDYLDGLARLRRNSGVDAGLTLLERAVTFDPESPLTHAALAEARWWKYKTLNDPVWLERTKESFRQAELRNPDLAEVHRISGLLLTDSGWYEHAVAEYLRAIELQPADSDAYRRMGRAYEMNNQAELALAAYKQAVALDPQYHRNHQALGNYYNERGNYSEAARHFRAQVELVPDEPAAHFTLGTAYMNLGRFAEAETELRQSLALGETPDSLNNLGAVLMFQGRDQEAIPLLSGALARWPEKYLWWINLGVAYRRVNLLAESKQANLRGLAAADTEVKKNPRNGYVRACLAYLCARLG